MGVNFYWVIGKQCPTCGHEQEDVRLHIGKSSAGWCFSLRVYPQGVDIGNGHVRSISCLRDWFDLFDCYPEAMIVNEHDEPFTVAKLARTITCRFNHVPWERHVYQSMGEPWSEELEKRFHLQNHSERGPNNLLRARVGEFCIGHGEGTWDLFDKEFC